jgi:uncharacterized repeat protein (TIGR01451 family)
MFRRLTLGAALAAAIVAPAAAAAGPFEVVSKILVEKKQAAGDGTTRIALVPAKHAVPGDHVVFVLAYRNTGKAPIANIVLDNPVPAGIAYRAPAQGSPVPDLSVDGKNYGALASLSVQAPAGRRAAGPDDVTHVRWRLTAPLAAGAQGQLAFQAVLK